MRIVIDCRMINESGIGRYIKNLLLQLTILDKKNTYIVLVPQDEEIKLPKNFIKVVVNLRWYTLEEQIKLPKILSELNPDLVHFPHFNVPIFWNGKFIVTIHDLIHQHQSLQKASTHGKLVFSLKKFGYKKVFGHALRKSEKILVPSNFIKAQLKSEWRVADEKIIVTPEAVDKKFLIKKRQFDESGVLKKHGISPPYIFYVGNAHPHKNLERLIKAFLVLRENYQYLQLVLTGKENYFWKQLQKKYQNKNIIYTNFVTDDELVDLYMFSECFVEPSVEEGFGLPLLEAMSLGTPVVSSDIGSLKEVGGDAAIYFYPLDINDIAEKIKELLNSQVVKKELSKRGVERAKEFSWEKMAEDTWRIYKQCG